MASTALPFLAESWFIQALTSRMGLLCGGIILVSLLLIVLMFRAAWRLGRSPESRVPSPESKDTSSGASRLATRDSQLATFIADTRGTTSLEFALVFPVLLILCLLLTQAMMMMAGNMYVHYAAFQATRQATIEIPQDYTQDGDLEANHYSPSGIKHDRIRQAAYMALVPVAGQIDSGSGPANEMVSAIRNHYGAFGATEPKWIESMLAGKVYYAEANTEIFVMETNVHPDDMVTFDELPESPYRFGVRDVVSVRVVHKLNLGVPFVSRFFADGENGGKGPGRYTEVAAIATLPNEGVPVPLPEKPDIDRFTPSLPTGTDPYSNTNRPGGPRPANTPTGGTTGTGGSGTGGTGTGGTTIFKN